MSNKQPDYAHADTCRQEMRSIYVFDLYVSRRSAQDLQSKLKQLPFKAEAPVNPNPNPDPHQLTPTPTLNN